MKRLLLLGLLLYLGITSVSYAQVVDPIFGEGNITCYQWNSLRSTNSAVPAEQWVLGSISGLAESFQDFLHRNVAFKGNGDQIFPAVDRECNMNLSENLNMATIHVFMNSGSLFGLQNQGQ